VPASAEPCLIGATTATVVNIQAGAAPPLRANPAARLILALMILAGVRPCLWRSLAVLAAIVLQVGSTS